MISAKVLIDLNAKYTAGYIGTLLLAALSGAADAQTISQDSLVKAEIHSMSKDGGPRRFRVVNNDKAEIHLYEMPSLTSARLEVITGDTVLTNLGCKREGNHVWCHVKPLQQNAATGYTLGAFLVPAHGPDGVVPMGPDDSRKRARKHDFDAHEQVLCAQEVGQALGTCTAHVARGGGGDAAVVVAFSNGFARTLYFVHGMFTVANATMSGVGTDTDWQTKDGVHLIRVDDQRYEIADAFIVGEPSHFLLNHCNN